MKLRQIPVLVLLPVLIGCATNPVTGKNELSLIPEEQAIAMGQRAAGQIVQQMGLYPDDALQKYVSDLGMAMATSSERPNLPWKFYVLEDDAVNAFALPGGSIFVTRGILTHMNSEAELVSVLGHEIGHVTAKHSVSQMSKQQLAQIGLGLGTVLVPELAEWGDLASAGLGFLFLKFGRDDEKQSDALGFRYMVAQGYDPREMAAMFRTLDRQATRQGGGGIPEWASTHPAPANRVGATEARVKAMTLNPDTLKVHREDFLVHLDGMTFGENPRMGYFKDNVFYHPDLAFEMAFPKGWTTVNQPNAVVGLSAERDAMIQLTLAGAKAPHDAARDFFKETGIEKGDSSAEAINGLDAYSGYFRATTTNGVLAGLASFIRQGDNTYQIVSFTSEEKLGQHDNRFLAVIHSFRRVTDRAVLNVQPAKIDLVDADRNMTLEQFQKRYPSSIPLDQLALINGLDAGATIPKGRMVKRVVGGELP